MSPRPAKILMLDPDQVFARRLGQQLNQAPGNNFDCRTLGEATVAEQVLERDKAWDLIILAEDFPLTPRLKQSLAAYPQVRKARKARPWHKELISQGMKLTEIIRLLDQNLARAAPGGISAKPLVMAYSFNLRLRQLWLQNFLRQQARLGHPLYYFPLAPAYQVSLPLVFSPGPELSSLLLLLSTGAQADYDSLGPCFEAQERGCYALRTGGRPEDLVLSPLKSQKEVLKLFRLFIRSRSETSVGLVELGSLPFPALKALTAVADVFVAEMPRAQDYAAQAGRQEMQALLASLPPSVHFVEMNPYDLKLQSRSNAHVPPHPQL